MPPFGSNRPCKVTPMVLVSACLTGFRCRYDGCFRTDRGVLTLLSDHAWMPVCPEQMAGLSTPRPPLAFTGGTGMDAWQGRARVLQQDHGDVTHELMQASRFLVRRARAWGVRRAILKERSPSCGVNWTYIGEERVAGMGIFAAVLYVSGIEVTSDETLNGWEVRS